MKKTTKSQIQIGETIAVLFVFIILVVIAFVVYSGFEKSKIKQNAEEKIGLSADEIALRVMFLPELSCTKENIPEYHCFDSIKLEKSSEIMRQNWLLYQSLFLESNISALVIYSPLGEDIKPAEYIVYSNVPKNATTKIQTIVPITIFNATAEKGYEFSFGLLKVEVYTK